MDWGGTVYVGHDNLGSGIGIACCLLDGQIGFSLYSQYASWRSFECESQLGAIIAMVAPRLPEAWQV